MKTLLHSKIKQLVTHLHSTLKWCLHVHTSVILIQYIITLTETSLPHNEYFYFCYVKYIFLIILCVLSFKSVYACTWFPFWYWQRDDRKFGERKGLTCNKCLQPESNQGCKTLNNHQGTPSNIMKGMLMVGCLDSAKLHQKSEQQQQQQDLPNSLCLPKCILCDCFKNKPYNYSLMVRTNTATRNEYLVIEGNGKWTAVCHVKVTCFTDPSIHPITSLREFIVLTTTWQYFCLCFWHTVISCNSQDN